MPTPSRGLYDSSAPTAQSPRCVLAETPNRSRFFPYCRKYPSPNGLALSPDEKALFLAVTRANQIWRLPLHPDGTTSKVAAFITLSGGLAGPDGVAIDDAA